MAVFRGKLLAAIRQALAPKVLTLSEAVRPQQMLNLLTRLGHPKKTTWNVHIRERYRHGAGVVTYLARYLRGGPLKHARLVAWDGDRVTFTCRARQEEADGDRPVAQRITVAVADFLQRWLLHVPVPQTRVIRSYRLYHPTQAEALAVCRVALGQPPVEAPVVLDWQTVCARQGDTHPERCPTCGQLLGCTGVIPRGGAPPPLPCGASGMSAGLQGRPVRGVVRLPEAVTQPATAGGSPLGFSRGQRAPSHAQGRGRWRLCQVGGPRGRAA